MEIDEILGKDIKVEEPPVVKAWFYLVKQITILKEII